MEAHFLLCVNASEVVCGMKWGRQPFVTIPSAATISRLQMDLVFSLFFCFCAKRSVSNSKWNKVERRTRQLTTPKRNKGAELCNKEKARMTFDAIDAASFQSKCRATRHPRRWIRSIVGSNLSPCCDPWHGLIGACCVSARGSRGVSSMPKERKGIGLPCWCRRLLATNRISTWRNTSCCFLPYLIPKRIRKRQYMQRKN